jgi:hypothetical protein
MKTFTLRELSRLPALVLAAAESDGAVLVRRRGGRTYRIQPEPILSRRANLPDFDARRRALGIPEIPRHATETVDRWMAGE